MHTYIVHYGELGLKGQNRPDFEKRLAHNICATLAHLGEVKVRRRYSFMVAVVEGEVPTEVIEERLTHVFGIAYFAPALVVPQEMERIREATLKLAQESITPQTSFKVDTRRSDKRFPVNSMDVNRRLGAAIQAEIDAPVNLDAPDVTLYVQIYPEGVYVFARRIDGPGGLPVGTGGRVITMLSGGIDSPVAAHMMLKRGCSVDFLHFHMLRGTEEIRNSKVVTLARKVMEPHRLPATIYMAPAHPFQVATMEHESRVELVVFRRFILQVAERVARRRRALAFVTGDNLGQVASQTLKNLHVTSRVAEMPILRPLIAFNKQEIIGVAQEIGTYEISIEPYQDPCSFRARHPATWAKMADVQDLEAKLDLDALVEQTVAQIEEIRIEW